MAILVTGGEGYIGSHCVIALLDAGYNVVIFDNESTGHAETGEALMKIESKGRLEAVYKGDLLVRDDLDAAFEIYRIDAVIHFAAFSQVAESMSDPAKYYRNNVTGTMNLLDSMVAHDVKRIVFSSTAATYGEPDYTPIDEKHPQNPINPYGRTKLDIEYMMDDYDRLRPEIGQAEILQRGRSGFPEQGRGVPRARDPPHPQHPEVP
jgi:UDP-glucose 4-epimerase